MVQVPLLDGEEEEVPVQPVGQVVPEPLPVTPPWVEDAFDMLHDGAYMDGVAVGAYIDGAAVLISTFEFQCPFGFQVA